MTNNQKGFAGVGVILMLVVLGAIAVTGNMLYRQKANTNLLEITGAQAYQAARSGIEWGLYQSIQNNSCVASSSVSFGGTLSNYTVVVQCTSSTINEGNSSKTINNIVSTACNATTCISSGADAFYVERQIQVAVVK